MQCDIARELRALVRRRHFTYNVYRTNRRNRLKLRVLFSRRLLLSREIVISPTARLNERLLEHNRPFPMKP